MCSTSTIIPHHHYQTQQPRYAPCCCTESWLELETNLRKDWCLICTVLLCWSLDTSYKKLKWMFGEILCFWDDPAAAAALLSGWRCSLSDLNNFANKQHIYHQVLLLSSFYFPFPRHNSHILEAIASTWFPRNPACASTCKNIQLLYINIADMHETNKSVLIERER